MARVEDQPTTPEEILLDLAKRASALESARQELVDQIVGGQVRTVELFAALHIYAISNSGPEIQDATGKLLAAVAQGDFGTSAGVTEFFEENEWINELDLGGLVGQLLEGDHGLHLGSEPLKLAESPSKPEQVQKRLGKDITTILEGSDWVESKDGDELLLAYSKLGSVIVRSDGSAVLSDYKTLLWKYNEILRNGGHEPVGRILGGLQKGRATTFLTVNEVTGLLQYIAENGYGDLGVRAELKFTPVGEALYTQSLNDDPKKK